MSRSRSRRRRARRLRPPASSTGPALCGPPCSSLCSTTLPRWTPCISSPSTRTTTSFCTPSTSRRAARTCRSASRISTTSTPMLSTSTPPAACLSATSCCSASRCVCASCRPPSRSTTRSTSSSSREASFWTAPRSPQIPLPHGSVSLPGTTLWSSRTCPTSRASSAALSRTLVAGRCGTALQSRRSLSCRETGSLRATSCRG
mmetsp:Transcript_21941/g.60906  ORF Transcript_21941/g.60906 Transcript_21941/m.60906 type:complete len:203 (+) Transcript_21941:4071-4679(+)